VPLECTCLSLRCQQQRPCCLWRSQLPHDRRTRCWRRWLVLDTPAAASSHSHCCCRWLVLDTPAAASSHSHCCCRWLVLDTPAAASSHSHCCCRWLGIDKIMLRENNAALNPDLVPRLQPFVDSGFLDVDVWPGRFLQRELGEACTDVKLLGKFSWIGLIDVDEFIIMYQECAPRTTAHAHGFTDNLRCCCHLS
jgi:hypothetical protein